jgi:hypothetical protein
MRRPRRLLAVLWLSCVAAVLLVAPAGAQAGPTDVTIPSSAEQITSYHSDLQIEPAGSLLVHEQIVYDFGVVPHHGIYRDITDRFPYDDVKSGYDRVTPIEVISVQGSAGTLVDYTTDEDGHTFRIKIGDPDTTITGVHTYDITFRVRGVYNAFPDHDELVWNAVSTGGRCLSPTSPRPRRPRPTSSASTACTGPTARRRRARCRPRAAAPRSSACRRSTPPRA